MNTHELIIQMERNPSKTISREYVLSHLRLLERREMELKAQLRQIKETKEIDTFTAVK